MIMAEITAQSESSSVDIRTIIRDIISGWWIILLAVVIAGMGSFIAVTELYSPVYTSTATYVVSATGNTATVYTNLSAAQTLADAFSNVLSSNIMRRIVCDDLGISSFDGKISAEVVSETNILTLTVTASRPDTAYLVCRSLMENHSEVTDAIMSNAILQVLKSPSVPSSPSNKLNRRGTVTKVMFAAAIAAAAALGAISYLRDTCKTEKDFTGKIDGQLLVTVHHEQKYKTLISRIKHPKKGLLITDPTTGFLFTESFKKLRTKIEYRLAKEGKKVIAIGSVLENEGKSTVAANIALALAQKHRNVVLLDADMRRPAIHKLFSTDTGALDLAAVLTGQISAEQATVTEPKTGLKILCCEKTPPRAYDLVSSEAMRELINKLKAENDFVIIDTPPMAVASDAEAIASYADTSILTVRQGVTYIRDINDAIDNLRDAGGLLGCVFNDVRSSAISAGYGYGYGYGYGKAGYGKYGYGDRTAVRD